MTNSYHFRVYGENGSTAWSGIKSLPSEIVTIPAKPKNLSVSDVTSTTAKLTWTTSSPHGADRWLIYKRQTNGTWVEAGTSTAKSYTVTVNDMTNSYQFRVYGENGSPGWSGLKSLPSEIVTVPAKPTNLSASNVTAETAKLTWTTSSPHGADRWRVEYTVGTQAWQEVDTVTYKSFSMSGLSASTVYAFRVFGENDNADGTVTDSLVSNTLRIITLPAQPTNLTASNVTGNSVTLSWNTASPHGSDRWLIQYRVSGGTWSDYGTSKSKSCTVTGLSPNTTYEFRVYGERYSTSTWPGEYSVVSNVVTATTVATQPVQPTELIITGLTENSISLAWSTDTPHYADRWLIQYRPENGTWINYDNTTDQYLTVSNLTEGTRYEFRVYAEAGNTPWQGTWSLARHSVVIAPNSSLAINKLQDAFKRYPNNGDWDGLNGLQCVDLYRWFIETYTSLDSTSGDGKDCASNLASANDLTIRTTPTAYSIFSATGEDGIFGSDSIIYGHTGVVISVNVSNKTCKVLHTGNSKQYDNPNSWITTYSYDVSGVTFVDVSGYLG